MNRTRQQFFALLQAGLWNNPIDMILFEEDTDWECILTMAKEQTVNGILFDGIVKLPSEKQPSVVLMRNLYQTVIRIEQSHELLNQGLVEIVSLLQSKGIRSVLLKGQGVAQNYPNPMRRQYGDIDLYVGKKEIEKAYQVLLQICTEPQNKKENSKHKKLYLGKISIDLHFLIENNDKKFQHWFDSLFLQEEKLRIWLLNETNIALPPITFDTIYIFKHAYNHFILGGIGLRQLCDWAIYLDTFNDQINREELLKKLKVFGLLRAWKLFGCVIVNRIGLPKDKFPFYTEQYEKVSEKILEEIMQAGNFGFYDSANNKRPDEYLSGKLYIFKVRCRRFGRLFFLFPIDTGKYFIRFLILGVRRVIKDKLKR